MTWFRLDYLQVQCVLLTFFLVLSLLKFMSDCDISWKTFFKTMIPALKYCCIKTKSLYVCACNLQCNALEKLQKNVAFQILLTQMIFTTLISWYILLPVNENDLEKSVLCNNGKMCDTFWKRKIDVSIKTFWYIENVCLKCKFHFYIWSVYKIAICENQISLKSHEKKRSVRERELNQPISEGAKVAFTQILIVALTFICSWVIATHIKSIFDVKFAYKRISALLSRQASHSHVCGYKYVYVSEIVRRNMRKDEGNRPKITVVTFVVQCTMCTPSHRQRRANCSYAVKVRQYTFDVCAKRLKLLIVWSDGAGEW